MEKVKEYKGVPKRYILLACLVCLVFGWFMPPPLTTTFGIFCLTVILSTIGMMIVHELLHGVWIKIFAGKVSFGTILVWKVLPYAFYATTQEKLTRNQFIIVALFPQVLFIPCVLVALVNHNPLVDYIAILIWFCNLAGGISDLWATFTIARYSKETLVEDTKTGMAIYQTVQGVIE